MALPMIPKQRSYVCYNSRRLWCEPYYKPRIRSHLGREAQHSEWA